MLITKHLSFTLIISISLTFLFAPSAKARDYGYEDDSDYFEFKNGRTETSSKPPTNSRLPFIGITGGLFQSLKFLMKEAANETDNLKDTFHDSTPSNQPYRYKAGFVMGYPFSERLGFEFEGGFGNYLTYSEIADKESMAFVEMGFNLTDNFDLNTTLKPILSTGAGIIAVGVRGNSAITSPSLGGVYFKWKLGLTYPLAGIITVRGDYSISYNYFFFGQLGMSAISYGPTLNLLIELPSLKL